MDSLTLPAIINDYLRTTQFAGLDMLFTSRGMTAGFIHRQLKSSKVDNIHSERTYSRQIKALRNMSNKSWGEVCAFYRHTEDSMAQLLEDNKVRVAKIVKLTSWDYVQKWTEHLNGISIDYFKGLGAAEICINACRRHNEMFKTLSYAVSRGVNMIGVIAKRLQYQAKTSWQGSIEKACEVEIRREHLCIGYMGYNLHAEEKEQGIPELEPLPVFRSKKAVQAQQHYQNEYKDKVYTPPVDYTLHKTGVHDNSFPPPNREVSNNRYYHGNPPDMDRLLTPEEIAHIEESPQEINYKQGKHNIQEEHAGKWNWEVQVNHPIPSSDENAIPADALEHIYSVKHQASPRSNITIAQSVGRKIHLKQETLQPLDSSPDAATTTTSQGYIDAAIQYNKYMVDLGEETIVVPVLVK